MCWTPRRRNCLIMILNADWSTHQCHSHSLSMTTWCDSWFGAITPCCHQHHLFMRPQIFLWLELIKKMLRHDKVCPLHRQKCTRNIFSLLYVWIDCSRHLWHLYLTQANLAFLVWDFSSMINSDWTLETVGDWTE